MYKVGLELKKHGKLIMRVLVIVHTRQLPLWFVSKVGVPCHAHSMHLMAKYKAEVQGLPPKWNYSLITHCMAKAPPPVESLPHLGS